MTVKEGGEELFRYDLSMHNTGDVDVQILAGAIATGTPWYRKKLQNLSSMLVGVRMITGTGEIVEIALEEDQELFRALRVALGTCEFSRMNTGTAANAEMTAIAFPEGYIILDSEYRDKVGPVGISLRGTPYFKWRAGGS